MAIVFAPIRQCRRSVAPDLCVKLRRYRGVLSLELTLSAKTQDRVRYVDGDRVIATFDEKNRSWSLERISPDRTADGYKVLVRPLAKGSSEHVSFRVGCQDSSVVTAILGAGEEQSYDFLEVTGNKATFVERE